MKKILFSVLVLILPLSASAQNLSTLSLRVMPRLEFPLGSYSEQFSLGGGGQFSIAYKPPVKFPFYIAIDGGYAYLPINLDWSSPVHAVLVGGGLGLDLRFLGRLGADLYVRGGYYEGFIESIEGETIHGGNPYLDTGAEISFYFSPLFRIGVGSSYREYFGNPASFYRSINLTLGGSYSFLLNGNADLTPVNTLSPRIQFREFQLGTIFPVFYKYYDTQPIGSVTIENREKGTIDGIEVSVFMKNYMDYPKTHAIEGSLKRGQQLEIDLYALFNEKVLEITEGAKVSTEFSIDYNFKDSRKHVSRIETVSLQNRNASIWDDDRRAAAFITARDPVILRLGKNLAGLLREETSSVMGRNFMLTLAVHEALSRYGVSYVVDPNTPYEIFHQQEQAVDFLQFPRQTLEYRAGDCDDLSILYSAILEALSVETALVTAPGHIYIAVNLSMKPEEAREVFFHTDDLIFRGDDTWLPFEVTLTGDTFLRAWQEGAREWYRYEPSGQSGFFPVSEAWKIFEPVGLPGEGRDLDLPGSETIKTAYVSGMSEILQREVENKVKDLRDRIAASNNNTKLINSLGILYARYGMLDAAEKEFQEILKKAPTSAVLVNLGNIQFIGKDFEKASAYYLDSLKLNPGSPKVMVNLARAYYELKKYPDAQKLYGEIKVVSPGLAESYAYLGTGETTSSRASDAAEKGALLWED